MKVTEVERLQSLEDARPTLKQRITRDSRSKLGKTVLIQRIKDEYGFEMQEESLQAFAASLTLTSLAETGSPIPARRKYTQRRCFPLVKPKGIPAASTT